MSEPTKDRTFQITLGTREILDDGAEGKATETIIAVQAPSAEQALRRVVNTAQAIVAAKMADGTKTTPLDGPLFT